MKSNLIEKYTEITKINDNINNKLNIFINKATELIELSEDEYQIEKSLKLNKISLKGYILESSCCVNLYNNNTTDYSIEDLKDYFLKYEIQFNKDYSKYYLAISLYELIEEIENLTDLKIKLEIEFLNNIIPNIISIKDIDKNKYEEIYFKSKEQLKRHFKDINPNNKNYTTYLEILNDIFAFYINGYPTIPNEYLYKNVDS